MTSPSSSSDGRSGYRRQPEIVCDTREKSRSGRCLKRVVTTTFPQKVEGGPRRHRRDIVNRAELIDAIRDRLGIEKKTAEHAVDAVLDTIQEAVARGEKVAITGFGVFEKVDRAARTGRNPATGEPVEVQASSVPKFRPGSEFKAYVSGAKEFARGAVTSARAAAAQGARAVGDALAPDGAGSGGASSSAGASGAGAGSASAVDAPAKKAPAKKSAAEAAEKAPAKKATADRTLRR